MHFFSAASSFFFKPSLSHVENSFALWSPLRDAFLLRSIFLFLQTFTFACGELLCTLVPSPRCISSPQHLPFSSNLHFRMWRTPLHFGPLSAMHFFSAASSFFFKPSLSHVENSFPASFLHAFSALFRAALFSLKHFSSACFW